MDQKRKEELSDLIEEIFDQSITANEAWEKIGKLAQKEGKEEVYLTLLENIIDDLLDNWEEIDRYLDRIGWPRENRKEEKG